MATKRTGGPSFKDGIFFVCSSGLPARRSTVRVAESCRAVPFAMAALAGVTWMETRTAGVTVGTVTVRNEEDAPALIQAEAFVWSQAGAADQLKQYVEYSPFASDAADMKTMIADLEKRVRFIRKIGAEPILCVSYMPQPFDAVPDGERHSAPKEVIAELETIFAAYGTLAPKEKGKFGNCAP